MSNARSSSTVTKTKRMEGFESQTGGFEFHVVHIESALGFLSYCSPTPCLLLGYAVVE